MLVNDTACRTSPSPGLTDSDFDHRGVQSPVPLPHAFVSASLKGQCLKLMREVLDSRRRDWGALTEESVRTETLALIRSELKAQLD